MPRCFKSFIEGSARDQVSLLPPVVLLGIATPLTAKLLKEERSALTTWLCGVHKAESNKPGWFLGRGDVG